MGWFSTGKRVQEQIFIESKPSRKELETKIESLEKELDTYKQWWKNMIDTTRDAEIAVDFAAIDAFSVERTIRDGLPTTIIGYLKGETEATEDGTILTNKGVKEWYYHCSDKRHQELVDKFKEYKNLTK
jgi:hypothetical protein